MATRTDNLTLWKPEIGADDEPWGEMLNQNADIIEAFSESVLTVDSTITLDQVEFSGNLDMGTNSIVDVGTLSFSNGGYLSSSGEDFTFTTASGAVWSSEDRASINQFLTSGRTLRQAIDAAHDKFAETNGGTLYFPARAEEYEVDNTGLGPITLTTSSVWWEGDGAECSVIQNTSTDGTALLLLDGGSTALKRCGWRKLKFDSLSTAGEIWLPGENGLSFCRWENLYVLQKALTKSIMRGTFTDSGGMFENQWVGGVWEVGTSSNQYTAIGFDLRANANLITLNKWQDMRFHCHNSANYMFRLECTSGGASIHQNEWRGLNVEVPNGGFIWVLGAQGHIFSDIYFYDIQDSDGPTRDLIREDIASGGGICEGNIYHKITSGWADEHRAVAGTTVAVTSITRVGSTATVTATAHGLTDGQVAYQTGSNQSEYNGRFVVDRLSSSQYTITVDGSPASPATGTMTTGSGTMDIRLGDSSQMAMFIGCAGVGTVSPIQIDLNNRGATVIGDSSSRLQLYRISEANTTILGMGTGAHVSTGTVYSDNLQERTAGAGITVSGATTFQDGVVAEEGVSFGVGGSKISLMLKVTESIALGTIPAHTTIDRWVTLAGVEQGDRVTISPNSLPEDGLAWYTPHATASGFVVARFANVTASPVGFSTRNWLITSTRH